MSVAVANPPMRWLASAASYVRARWVSWLFVGTLATIALLSSRLALQTKPTTSKAAAGSTVLRHAPDFSATQIVQWRSSADGATRYRIQAAAVTHYRDDLSSVWTLPEIEANAVKSPTQGTTSNIPQHSTLRTHIRAQTATAYNDGERIEFAGQVRVDREPAGAVPTALASETLTVLTDTATISTRSAVTLTQGANRSAAESGLSYQHADAILTLNGRVRTTLAGR